MLLLKLSLLTCACYLVLTIILEFAFLAFVRVVGDFSGSFPAKHSSSWAGLMVGVIFGILWLISFGVAWHIVYRGVRSRFPFLNMS